MSSNSTSRPGTIRNARNHKAAGTQSIGRAIAALRKVAQADKEGARLVDVAVALKLKTPTALRLLKALVSEGLVSVNSANKTYHIGAELISLSAIASTTSTPTERLMPLLSSVWESVGDTVYLMVRRGNDCICTAVLEGRHPVRVMTFKVGEIRPLGVGSASLALLAFLESAERSEILRDNDERFKSFGMSAQKLEAMGRDARKTGFAVNPGLLIPGVYGLAFPLFEERKLTASVGVIAMKERLTPARRLEIMKIVRRSVAKVKGFTITPPYSLD